MSDERDDIQLEEEETSPKDALKKLRDKLSVAEEKAKDYLDKWQRAQADFVNIRKRDEEAKGEFLKFANASLVLELLPVLDSLNLAVTHGDKEAEAICKQFLSVLKANGLEEFSPLGEVFDPKVHEAIGTEKTDKEEENHKVVEVLQKGYNLSGKILRPAKVKIAEYNN